MRPTTKFAGDPLIRTQPPAGLQADFVPTGCATPAPETTAAHARDAQRCQQVTGSSTCRQQGSGRMAHVQSISGEALKRSPDPMAGPGPFLGGH